MLLSRIYARILARLGDRARDRRDWPRAGDAYRRALRRNPSLEPIWVQYGHASKESGDLAEAETAYRRALALDPANADTLLQLGHLLKSFGRFDDAEQAYRRVQPRHRAEPARTPAISDAHCSELSVKSYVNQSECTLDRTFKYSKGDFYRVPRLHHFELHLEFEYSFRRQ